MPHNPNKSKKQATSNINSQNHRLVRFFYVVMGFIFLFLGLVGIILPVMPTTVFIIAAAWCWAKGSERFHSWLIHHKIFGQILLDWQEKRAMPRKAKYLAWFMMLLSCIFLCYRLPENLWWVALLVSILCLSVSIWMARLPDA